MPKALLILQIILSLSLSGLVLIQSKGTGLSRTFGGGQNSFTRRGLEKAIFKATFVVSALFLTLSIFNLTI